jgi:hypothetical protein
VPRVSAVANAINAPSAVLIIIQVFDKSMKIVTMCHDVS